MTAVYSGIAGRGTPIIATNEDGPRSGNLPRSVVCGPHLGSATDWLRLVADQASHGAPESVLAELQLEGLSASRRVVHGYTGGFEDLADFFGGLADSWRGWESVEGDLKIAARHEYGHAQFRITVRRDGLSWGNDGWTMTADLTVDPGEQLSNVAADMRSLAAGQQMR